MVKHKSLKATINLNHAREIKLSIKKTGSISQARRFKENVLISDMDKKKMNDCVRTEIGNASQ